MSKLFKIDSISQIHNLLGYEKPRHPLITVIESSKIKSGSIPEIKDKIINELYLISLKNGNECKIKYGRQNYDFQEGTVIFISPGQIITPVNENHYSERESNFGWTLLFHPHLIRKSNLGNKMKEYTYFSYNSHEALHISEHERDDITNIVMAIKKEYSQNIDVYSQELIINNLELLLNYFKRYYGRQFITRTSLNKDMVIRFEDFLKDYFESENSKSRGLLSVKSCAEQMGYSTNYFSDLLKKETGKNTQEHIQFYMIGKAKTMLLGTEYPINRIAYSLGFEYPQHFSKLFKNKTGLTPSEYRK